MTQIPFIDEARELAEDDHYTLALELEVMRAHPCDYGATAIYWWKRDNEWHEDAADFFEQHRNYYLEQARELFSENVA